MKIIMKNYLNFENDIKDLEDELDKLKDPYNQEGLSEVDTKNISKVQNEIDDKLKEIYSNLFKASQFIKDKLDGGNHVWIAQKQGRSKDGIDKTDPAVLKMLHIALRKTCEFQEITNYYNIIPCSISYEIDPLAVEKSKQLQNTESKDLNEDISHIFKGVMLEKGKVKLCFADCIQGSYTPETLAHEIDKQILNNFMTIDFSFISHR